MQNKTCQEVQDSSTNICGHFFYFNWRLAPRTNVIFSSLSRFSSVYVSWHLELKFFLSHLSVCHNIMTIAVRSRLILFYHFIGLCGFFAVKLLLLIYVQVFKDIHIIVTYHERQDHFLTILCISLPLKFIYWKSANHKNLLINLVPVPYIINTYYIEKYFKLN